VAQPLLSKAAEKKREKERKKKVSNQLTKNELAVPAGTVVFRAESIL
jgi:hypothetical protein